MGISFPFSDCSIAFAAGKFFHHDHSVTLFFWMHTLMHNIRSSCLWAYSVDTGYVIDVTTVCLGSFRFRTAKYYLFLTTHNINYHRKIFKVN
jgi:hypothetical protein